MTTPPIATAPDSLTIERIPRPEREGWVCADCDPEDAEYNPVVWLVGEAPALRPVCDWHKAEAIHDSLPEFHNCPDCGREHSPLWNTDWSS